MSGGKLEKALSGRTESTEKNPSQKGCSESEGNTLIGNVSNALDGVS